MASAIVMPRQGQSVESCIITRWYKTKGEPVKQGDLLFSYETDKAAFDEEAKEDGVLLEIFFNEGDEVPVLENVAVIGRKDEDYSKFIADRNSAGKPAGEASGTGSEAAGGSSVAGSEAADGSSVTGSGSAGEASGTESGTANRTGPAGQAGSAGISEITGTRDKKAGDIPPAGTEQTAVPDKLRISPLARKIAGEHNVSVSGIKGTGPLGRIIERDVRAAAASPTGPEKGVTVQKLSKMRLLIARRMEESLKNSAQLTHHISADARKILNLRKRIKESAGTSGFVDININDMVCAAVVRSLKKHPSMNAHFMGDSIKVFTRVHLGIAVDTDRGLMVPVLRDADEMNTGGLANRIRSLAEQCRKGSIDPALLASENATFTVTNLGSYGIEMFTPVLNLPQTGILGVNTITYRPADTGDGTIGFIPMIGLSLTYDHRAIDGAPASAFLASVKKEIENFDNRGVIL